MSADWANAGPTEIDKVGVMLHDHIALEPLEPDPEGDPIELEAFANLLGDLDEIRREGNEVEGAMQRSAESGIPISAQLNDWALALTRRIDEAVKRYRGES